MNEEEIQEMIAEEDIASDIQIDDSSQSSVVIEMSNKQPLYKSWGFWLSITGLISVLFGAFGLWEKIGITSDTFSSIVEAIGSVLVAFGLVNNPYNSSGLT